MNFGRHVKNKNATGYSNLAKSNSNDNERDNEINTWVPGRFTWNCR